MADSKVISDDDIEAFFISLSLANFYSLGCAVLLQRLCLYTITSAWSLACIRNYFPVAKSAYPPVSLPICLPSSVSTSELISFYYVISTVAGAIQKNEIVDDRLSSIICRGLSSNKRCSLFNNRNKPSTVHWSFNGALEVNGCDIWTTAGDARASKLHRERISSAPVLDVNTKTSLFLTPLF